MTDSPTRKKRFGAGICWGYMDKGACTCEITAYNCRWHPKLSVTAAAPTETLTSGATVVCMPKPVPEWMESLKYQGFIEGDPNNFAILTEAAYEEREKLNEANATYSPGMKEWITVPGQDLAPFAKWKPRINNHGLGEIVMYNPYIDRKSTVRELQRCGFHNSHFDVKGEGIEAENLRKELSGTAQHQSKRTSAGIAKAGCSSGVIDLCSVSPAAKESVAATVEGDMHAKRLRFSSPEALHSFVRRKQSEQTGEARHMNESLPHDSMEVGSKQQNELSELLSTAKSALVRCHSAGGVSTEQKQFNETIYTVVEAITAKLNSKESSRGEGTPPKATTSPSHSSSRQAMVTPAQKVGASGKLPLGVPETWYDTT